MRYGFFLFSITLLFCASSLIGQEKKEEDREWMESEESKEYLAKLKTSDLKSVTLKNGKKLEAEKEVLSIKIGKEVKLKWLEKGKAGEGSLDREDLMCLESLILDSSQSSVEVTLPNGTSKTLKNVEFLEESTEKKIKPAEFEVFWIDTKIKQVRRDIYRFWDFKEIFCKPPSSSQKLKKISLEVSDDDDKKKKTAPDRDWMEDEKSHIFANKVKSSDMVKMKIHDGKWIESETGAMSIKVVDGFRIEGKIKGEEDKKKTLTKAGFLDLRAVENIDELNHSLTIVAISGKKTDLIRVEIENPKIEYYWVDDGVQQVRREFVRFWKLDSMEINEPPKPKKKTVAKKKKAAPQKNDVQAEQEKLAKKTEKSHCYRIILQNGEVYESAPGKVGIYFNSDFELQGLEDEKDRKRSVASVKALQKITEIEEDTHSFLTITPKGVHKKMTQVQVTEVEIEVIEKEGKSYQEFTVSFWDIKEIHVKEPDDTEEAEEK